MPSFASFLSVLSFCVDISIILMYLSFHFKNFPQKDVLRTPAFKTPFPTTAASVQENLRAQTFISSSTKISLRINLFLSLDKYHLGKPKSFKVHNITLFQIIVAITECA